MSQLIAPRCTTVDSIPLGRRIMEIMNDKGAAFTISGMAIRIGISRETLRLMIKGEREIYMYELEKIAKDLKVTVERILQIDTKEDRERFEKSLKEYTYKSVELAKELHQLSLGITEQFITNNHVGRAWHAVREYEKAHETWLEGLPIAQKVLENYEEPKLLLICTSNLSITFADRHDYQKLLEIVALAEPYFDVIPEPSGLICFSVARLYDRRGEVEKGLKKIYQYWNYVKMSNHTVQIAKATYNVAIFEYQMRNYANAEKLHESIITVIDQIKDPTFLCLFYQEYAKTLIRLNKMQKAERILHLSEKQFEIIHHSEQTRPVMEVQQQLLLLMVFVKRDVQVAKQLVQNESFSVSVRKIARKFLVEYYEGIGDTASYNYYQQKISLPYLGIDLLLNEKSHDIGYLLTLYDVVELVGWSK